MLDVGGVAPIDFGKKSWVKVQALLLRWDMRNEVAVEFLTLGQNYLEGKNNQVKARAGTGQVKELL